MMKTKKVLFLSAGLMFLSFLATFASATGIENELSEAITSSNALLSEHSGEMETRTEDALAVDEDDQDFSFQREYGVSYCEINGEEVPCEELFENTQAMLSALFQEMPFLRTMENWFPSLIQFGIVIALVGLVLSFIGFIFWIWMLVDAIKYQKEGRVAWILVIVFFNALGALVYLFAAKIGRKKESEE